MATDTFKMPHFVYSDEQTIQCTVKVRCNNQPRAEPPYSEVELLEVRIEQIRFDVFGYTLRVEQLDEADRICLEGRAKDYIEQNQWARLTEHAWDQFEQRKYESV